MATNFKQTSLFEKHFWALGMGEEFAGSENLGLAPRVLCEGSPAGLLLCQPFRRTLLQNPKVLQNSGGEGGVWTSLLGTGFSSHEEQLKWECCSY